MAKLPSESDLGGISNPASGRPIATYDVTGYARGAAALAGGVADLGKGIQSGAKEVSSALTHERATDDKLDVARARADFLTKKIELDGSVKDDQDYETLQERYNTKLGEIRAGSTSLIRNPKTRELFDLSIADDVAKASQGANVQANNIWKDKTLADSSTQLEAIRRAALKTQDPEERVRLIDSGNQIISSLADKNITSHATAAETKKKWTSDYAYGAVSLLPAAERVAVLDGFEGALRKQESGGNPAKVNQLGYAGLYQFGAPRLADMGIYTPGKGESLDNWSKTPANAPGKWTGTFDIPGRPDIKTIKDFLANPSAQEESFQIHTQKMDKEITQNGFDKYIGKDVGGTVITREGLQAMMHLGGVGGTRKTLESNGKDSPTDANGTSVLSYARFGNQSGLSRVASLLPEDTRNKMRMDAQNEVDRTTVKAAQAQSEVHDRAITDAAAGISPLPPRSSITDDPALDEPRRNTLLKQYDAAAGDVAKFDRAIAKFRDPNAGTFNPYDKDDRDNTDKIYKALGGDVPAMQAVVQRTGIVPKAAVVEMRGGLSSADPQKVGASLQLAANLVGGDKPDMFAGIDGGKEISEAGLAFRHYVYDRGMTAQEATAKIMEERTPEYEQKIKARIKSEDVNAIVKKELKDGDIRSAFDPSFLGLAPNPQLAFSPETRQRAMGDYEENFREKFAANGDVALSKKLALEDMKRVWGVSSVSGTNTVMKYPPERSPVYAGVENASEHIAAQAVSAIKEWNGSAVSNLPAADAALKLTPQERAFYERHLSNLTGPGGVTNPDGSRSTLFQTTVEHDGKFYTIPTVFDGKILWDKGAADPAAAAVEKVKQIGWDKFPAYKSEAEAEARYQQMHAYMDKDTEKFQKDPKSFDIGVDRSKIRLDEVKSTGQRFMSGQPPTYLLSYVDKNGHVQSIPKQFYADPVPMKDTQTAARAAESAKIQQRVGIDEDMGDLSRANFGVAR